MFNDSKIAVFWSLFRKLSPIQNIQSHLSNRQASKSLWKKSEMTRGRGSKIAQWVAQSVESHRFAARLKPKSYRAQKLEDSPSTERIKSQGYGRFEMHE